MRPTCSLTGANGVPLRIKGTTRLDLPLTSNISATTDVVVCENLTHDIILGLDILLGARAIIDLHGQCVMFRSPDPSIAPEYAYFATKNPTQNYLYLSKDVTIRPRQQQLISVVSRVSLAGKVLIEPLRNAHQRPLVIAKGVMDTCLCHQPFKILVANFSNVPIDLQQGSRISKLATLHTAPSNIGALRISSSTQCFTWNYIPADVDLPDLTGLTRPKQARTSKALKPYLDEALSSSEQHTLHQFLRKHKDVFASNPEYPASMIGIPPVVINTGHAPPQTAPSQRKHPLAHRYISDKVQDMLKANLIEPSTSPWRFPVVLAMKPNVKIRFCIDYRKLNTVTLPDAYSLQRLDDILDSFHGKSYFSSLDAASGFHQIPLDKSTRHKTAFSTRSGLFHWTRLPFGWINAPAIFQRTMDFILSGLSFECALVYIDDIIVYSSTFQDHLQHLEQVFKRLRHFQCQLRLDKCHFGFRSLEFLGHIITPQGAKTKPKIVKAIQDFPHPTLHQTEAKRKTAVKRFVALANFYRRFIEHFALIAAPLLVLTQKASPFTWLPKHERAFVQLKHEIASAPTLRYPQWNKEFFLSTDASDIGVGAVLEQQEEDSKRHPIQFISHSFNKTEKRWSMPEKELFAFVFALKKLRVYLYGRPFQWFTDAASLTTLTTVKTLSPKLLRWTLLISSYRFNIKHVSTTENIVPDVLSRYPISTISTLLPSLFVQSMTSSTNPFDDLPFTRDRFVTQQQLDPYCRIWIEKLLPNSTRLPELSTTAQDLFERCKEKFRSKERRLFQRFVLINDILWYIMDPVSYKRALPLHRQPHIRPVVPYCLRSAVLTHFHVPAHRSGTRTAQSVSKHFYWPYLHPDTHLFVASCHACNSRNSRLYLKGLLHSSPAASATHRMSLDIIGPRPLTAEGYRYILVMINHFTKWIVASPLRERSSLEIMKRFQEDWLSEGYACQQTFADRAPELWTTNFQNLLRAYGSSFIPGPPHHSQSQGHVERANRTIQDSIAKSLDGSQHHWIRFLKPVIQAYRHTIHESTGYTPFFMMHGWDPLPPSLKALLPESTPLSLTSYVDSLKESVKQAWGNATIRLKRYHEKNQEKLNRNRRSFSIPIGSFVYVRIPPHKGQSQAFQSYNSGLWKLRSYDQRSNRCEVATRVGSIVRCESVHSQYVFPFDGSIRFKPRQDYLSADNDMENETTSEPAQTQLKPHPHQRIPRRRGRPSKRRTEKP